MEAARTCVVASLVLTIGLLTYAPHVQAQNNETWMQVDIVQVRPDKLDDFVELYRDEINPALQQAGVPWRSAWRAGEFGETYERLFATPMASFAELDTGGPLAKVLDPRQLERVRDRLRQYTDARQSYAVQYRADLSVEADNVSGLSIARQTNLLVAPGRGADFEAFLRDNLDNFREAGVVFGVYRRRFGPGPVVWQIVENLHSYAELARGGILRAFGDESDEVLAGLLGVITEVERTVLEYDEELSFRAAPETSDQ